MLRVKLGRGRAGDRCLRLALCKGQLPTANHPPWKLSVSRVPIRNTTRPSLSNARPIARQPHRGRTSDPRETVHTFTRPHKLAMLARGALCRLAAEVPKQATHDLPKLASLVQSARAGSSLPIRTVLRLSQLQARSYATETVKKAVKAKAAAGEPVTRTATTKKPAAKKATKTKKAAPKKAKKKKAAPKKPARKTKKQLTDAEKESKVIASLRKLALKEPTTRSNLSAFQVYISEKTRGTSDVKLIDATKQWKDVSPAEHEVSSTMSYCKHFPLNFSQKYNHLAAERNEARAAEYKAWVESHTPEEIRIANNARRQLKKKLIARKAAADSAYKHAPSNTRPIEDTRQVKRARQAWTFFVLERAPSSDFKGIANTERLKLISEEFKALNASEKQVS